MDFQIPRSRFIRSVIVALGIAACYYVGARLGLRLALVRGQVTPFWPPTGIGLAMLLVAGWRAVPGIALGAVAVNMTLGPSGLAVLAITAGNTLAPVTSLLLLRLVGFRLDLSRIRDVVSLVFLGGLTGMLVSASFGAGALAIEGAVSFADLWTVWAVWWTGDAMGVLVVTPLLLSLRPAGPAGLRRLSRRQWTEAASLLAAVSVLGIAVAHGQVALLFLAFPLLVWGSWRLGLAATAPCVFAVSIMATIGAASGHGPFSGDDLAGRMVTLQMFNAAAALTALLLAAATSQRQAAQAEAEAAREQLEQRVRARTVQLSVAVEQTRRSEEQFRVLLSSVPDAVLAVDEKGRITLVNQQAEDLFGYLARDLTGTRFEDLIPERFRERYVVTAGTPLDLAISAQRRGGGEFPADITFTPLKTTGEDHTVACTVVTVRDMTERRRAEQAARELSEAQFRRRQALEINDNVTRACPRRSTRSNSTTRRWRPARSTGPSCRPGR